MTPELKHLEAAVEEIEREIIEADSHGEVLCRNAYSYCLHIVKKHLEAARKELGQ